MFEIVFMICVCGYIVFDLWYEWLAKKKVNNLEEALKLLTQVVDALNEDIEELQERIK